MSATVLYVDFNGSQRQEMTRLLARHGYAAVTGSSAREALDLLEHSSIDVVLVDREPAELDGSRLLEEIRRRDPELPLVVWAPNGGGAEDLMFEIGRALDAGERRRQTFGIQAPSRRRTGGCLVASSAAMQAVLSQVKALASNDQTTLLLLGETGSGKQFVARMIHGNSPRASQPYLEVNCSALPRELFESELFGHEKGAFTSATQRKRGLIEVAEGGTLLLDEIGELDAAMQVKLLQVLEEREFRRVGGTQMIPTNVRFMAATNRDLARAVKDGTFREDLYYRLNVVSVRIPPLRERREDIPALAQECVVQFAQELKRPARRIAPAALQMLARYHFPGNIRELQNMIERAVIFCDAPALDVEHFPPGVMFTTEAAPTVSTDQNAIHLTFQVGQDTLEKLDLSAIQKMLELTAGNKTEAARRLGLSRFSLERRLRKAQTQVRA